MAQGDPVNMMSLSSCVHVGLHVDAESHHYADGGGVDRLSLDGLIGVGYVMDLTQVETGISRADLQPLIDADPFDILLLKTRNSTAKSTWETFDTEHIFIAPDGAECIMELGVKGVALDCLGVEKYGALEGHTHKILLKDNRLVVFEGVDLRKVLPGYYWFVGLPLKLTGADGAPARALLIKDKSGDFLRAWRADKKLIRM